MGQNSLFVDILAQMVLTMFWPWFWLELWLNCHQILLQFQVVVYLGQKRSFLAHGTFRKICEEKK
jgi:hypothetical protein